MMERGRVHWSTASRRRDALELVRRRDGDAFLAVELQLVAQCADRDAENGRGMGAVAEAMLQRLDDEVALDIGDGAADQGAARRAVMAGIALLARRQHDGVGADLAA